jgi:hypothetical protein
MAAARSWRAARRRRRCVSAEPQSRRQPRAQPWRRVRVLRLTRAACRAQDGASVSAKSWLKLWQGANAPVEEEAAQATDSNARAEQFAKFAVRARRPCAARAAPA